MTFLNRLRASPGAPATRRALAVALVGLAVGACELGASGPQGDAEALALIDRVRAAHGSDRLDQAELAFAFRGVPFTAWRDGGRFRYARTLTDSAGRAVEEVVDNDGAHRLVDGAEVPLSETDRQRVATAVNSVVYFALLPAPLADPAVRARRLAPDTLGGRLYERLEVSFARDGGGADWEDRFVYWVDAERGTMDFLAYTYRTDPADTTRNETGSRFRTVLDAGVIGGVRVQDYVNLTADSVGTEIERYGDLYEAGRTWEVSRVVLDSVRVRPL